MYIFKNAFKSITRTKLRNILIGVIIVIIGISSTIALSIKNSADKLIQSYKDSSEIEATLTLNRESMRNDFRNTNESNNSKNPSSFMSEIPQLTTDMIKEYGSSEYVDNYKYSLQIGLNSTDIEKVTSDTDNNNNTSNQGGGMRPATIAIGNFSNSDFSIVGYNSLDAMSEFVNSTYQITSGNIFNIDSTDNECVISDELAEENDLSVGSKITLVNPNNESETYTFTVTGIYKDTSDSGEFSMFSNAANKIITNSNAVETIIKNSEVNSDTKLTSQVNSTFILKSSDVVDSFKEDLTSKGLNDYYTVNTNLDTIEKSLEPIQNLSSFSTMFLIIVLAIGGVILIVINMINIRERKYEIGVLRAIGMKKHKVLLQFVIELFAVTFISIIIGTALGSVLTVPIANSMLASEISSQESENSKVNQNFGFSTGAGQRGGVSMGGQLGDIRNTFSGNSNVNYVDKINAIIDINTVLELIGIGIILTLISSCISMISISRYTPLKILSNRT